MTIKLRFIFGLYNGKSCSLITHKFFTCYRILPTTGSLA